MTTTPNKVNKFYQLQKKIPILKKDQVNTHFHNKYYDINSLLEVIKPLMEELKVEAVQPIQFRDGKNLLITKFIDSETAEILEEGSIALPDNLEPHKMGSAITYYRRYSLASMLLLQAEDDDGNSTLPTVSKTHSQPVKKTATPTPQPTPQGESEVTITSYKEFQKEGNKGPYWSVAIETQEYGEASCLIFEEEFLPKFTVGERRILRFTQNGKYLNWSFPSNPYK